MAENSKIDTFDPLRRFCGETNQSYRLGEPFVVGGYRYYTDGRIAVRVRDSSPDTEQWPGGPRFPNSIADFPWWQKPFDAKAAVRIDVHEDFETYCDCCLGKGKGKFRTCPDCNGDEHVIFVASSGTRYKCHCKHCVGGISGDGTEIVTCPECRGFRYKREAFVELLGHRFSAGLVIAIQDIDPDARAFVFVEKTGPILIADVSLPGKNENARVVLMGLTRIDHKTAAAGERG